MTNNKKIHIPTRKKQQAKGDQVVKVSQEAYNALVEVYNESQMSLKGIASLVILESMNHIVYDKED